MELSFKNYLPAESRAEFVKNLQISWISCKGIVFLWRLSHTEENPLDSRYLENNKHELRAYAYGIENELFRIEKLLNAKLIDFVFFYSEWSSPNSKSKVYTSSKADEIIKVMIWSMYRYWTFVWYGLFEQEQWCWAPKQPIMVQIGLLESSPCNIWSYILQWELSSFEHNAK